MATEGPLLHDGSMCTAFANFYNPGSALAGPGGSGQFLGVTISAARVLSIASSPTAVGFYGILQNTPMATEACDVGILGISKVINGVAGSLAAGVQIMLDSSGRAILWASGAGNFKFGYTIEAATAQNQIISAFIFPANTGLT